ncbi:hypothetical protein A0H76_2439 [Hepatospora eriocheir]|uniref:Uncharacterized protein n=1 Tax=Hepatospora eriocheir TaxID=1081669 RepID=A0A1X0QFC1_9MICR|nr:hypothetical protein A0H76_2439 [Hepatospora eriocheir]
MYCLNSDKFLILYCNYILIVLEKTFSDELFKNPQLNNFTFNCRFSLFYIINFNIYLINIRIFYY